MVPTHTPNTPGTQNNQCTRIIACKDLMRTPPQSLLDRDIIVRLEDTTDRNEFIRFLEFNHYPKLTKRIIEVDVSGYWYVVDKLKYFSFTYNVIKGFLPKIPITTEFLKK